MSSSQHAEPWVIQNSLCDQDNRGNGMDIYMTAESLKVYDNPWVERPPPVIPAQDTRCHARENLGKKKRIRTDLLILGTFCVLLVIGIICLGVEIKNTNTELWKIINQLKIEKREMIKTFCAKKQKAKICKKNQWSGSSDSES